MTTRSDSFNRATSSSTIQSPSDGGANWILHGGGTWGISSAGTGDGNGGYLVSGSGVHYITLETSVSDVDVSITPRLAIGQFGPVARFADTNNLIFAWATSSNLRLYKVVSGTLTQLGSTYSATISVGDVIRLSAPSTDNLVVYLNDVSRVTATDSAGNTNTECGYRQNGFASTTMFDDFLATDLAAGGSSVPVFYHHRVQMGS